jgi:hypothetical protein
MDMDISALPPTRTVSPVPELEVPAPPPPIAPKETNIGVVEETKVSTRKTGVGSLMQAVKEEVKVPEFDMGAFGF